MIAVSALQSLLRKNTFRPFFSAEDGLKLYTFPTPPLFFLFVLAFLFEMLFLQNMCLWILISFHCHFSNRLAGVLRDYTNKRPVLYQTLYCLWLLSFNNEIADSFSSVVGLIPGIVEIIRKEDREKIRRVGLATLRVSKIECRSVFFFFFFFFFKSNDIGEC